MNCAELIYFPIGNNDTVIIKFFIPFILFIYNASYKCMVNTLTTKTGALVYVLIVNTKICSNKRAAPATDNCVHAKSHNFFTLRDSSCTQYSCHCCRLFPTVICVYKTTLHCQ